MRTPTHPTPTNSSSTSSSRLPPFLLRAGGPLLLASLASLALLGLTAIHDRSATAASAASASSNSDTSMLRTTRREAAACATRVLVCLVPSDDHDGGEQHGGPTCRTLGESTSDLDTNHRRAVRGADGAETALGAAAETVLTLDDPLLRVAVAGNHSELFHRPHDVFSVRVCPSYAQDEVGVRVLHHRQTRAQCGRALTYVEALLDGPEQRVSRLLPVRRADGDGDGLVVACEYSASLPIWEAGEYRLEMSVVHAGEATGELVEGLDPYRNYVLWSSHHALNKRKTPAAAPSGGRWVCSRGDSDTDCISKGKEAAAGYRCPWGGKGTEGYEWVEEMGGAASVLSPEAARSCMCRLPAKANASHPKLVLFGDSFSRQVRVGVCCVYICTYASVNR